MKATFLGVKLGETVGFAHPSEQTIPDFSEVIAEYGKPLPISHEDQQETVEAFAQLRDAIKRLLDD